MTRICLASSSPRRRRLLEQAGYDVRVIEPQIDDGRLLSPSVAPRQWVMSLAYLKARSVVDHLDANDAAGIDVVLGADTVCVVDGVVLGQPTDDADARRMIEAVRGRSHWTMTGVCLVDPAADRRMFAVDAAAVDVGDVGDEQIEQYISSGDWRGKAGAYNLAERIEAGWPITCADDPATVMGLPMRKLPQWVKAFLSSGRASSQLV